MSDKTEKYFASIYLAMLGDKIGFNNGFGEMLSKPIIVDETNSYIAACDGLTMRRIYEFIESGGIYGITSNNLRISDDTVMHLDTLKGLLVDYNSRDELYNNITKFYLESFKDIELMRTQFLAGRQTIEAIKNINAGTNWKIVQNNKSAGGSGGPMRTMCLGLAFYKSTDILKLIESTIMITSITHPNSIAFLGSIVSALFTSYAIKGMNPETWIFELIHILEGTVIDDIIEKIKPSYIEFFKEDKKIFTYKIMTYVETSFTDYNYSPTSIRSIYSNKRMLYYFDNFSANKKVLKPGSGADDVIIIAYDCLLMSKNNYEKLIYTAMINIGDSDTIGTIVSAWYGALYGFKHVAKHLINSTDEQYDITKTLAEELYRKYYEKNIGTQF